MTSYIYRSRFQPFCRDHYEAILGFYLEFAHEKEAKPDLILWVVRHIRTSALSYGIQLDDSDIDDDLFRHIVQFNPFRFHECLKEIQQGIVYYSNLDKRDVTYQNDVDAISSFLEWSRTNIYPISVPLSLAEMTEYIGDGTVLDAFKNPGEAINIENGRFNKLLKQTQPKLYETLNNQKDRNAKLNSVEELAKLLASRITDSCDQKDIKFFMPLFDQQDVQDSLSLRNSNWNYINRSITFTSEKTHPIIISEFVQYDISALNGFVLYSFLLSASIFGREQTRKMSEIMKQNGLKDFLINRSSTECFNKFEDRVKKLLTLYEKAEYNKLNNYISHPEQFKKIFDYIAVPKTTFNAHNLHSLKLREFKILKDLIEIFLTNPLFQQANTKQLFDNFQVENLIQLVKSFKEKITDDNYRELTSEHKNSINNILSAKVVDEINTVDVKVFQKIINQMKVYVN